MLEEVVAIAEEIADIDCCFVFCLFFLRSDFLCFLFLSNSCDFLVMIFRF